MNKNIAKDLEYQSFGKLFVIREIKYFKGILCECWCECGNFININKDDLISGKKVHCGAVCHTKKSKGKLKKAPLYAGKRIKARYNNLIRNRKKGKYSINLTLEEYTNLASSYDECHYCGAKINWSSKSSAYYLDRMDNTSGYSIANCVICCTRCNMAKGNRFTYKEWCELGKIIKSWN